MTQNTLDAYLEHELSAAPCKSALLMTDLMTGRVLLARNQEVTVPSASTIKLPVLLAMLEGVRQREFTLDQPIPITHLTEDTRIFDRGETVYSLRELLYWMITVSDNTATNTILDLLGFDRVNAYARDILGLQSTLCRRKMLDFSAARAGLDNTTSAADQCRCYTLLHHGGILDETMREVAMTMLKAQRSTDLFLRYISSPVTVAHKPGGLDGLDHDAGIFLLPRRPFYLGIFTWDGVGSEESADRRKLIGRLTKAIYDTYQGGAFQ